MGSLVTCKNKIYRLEREPTFGTKRKGKRVKTKTEGGEKKKDEET
jgi:hypothetical protein